MPWLLLSDAEQELSSSLSGLLVAAVPLVGVVVAWVAGHRATVQWRPVTSVWFGFAGGRCSSALT